QLHGFGIYFFFIILISIFKNCFRTFAWKFALGDNSPSFWLLFWARLAGETAGYLSSGSIFVGEPLKVMLVRDRLHWKEGVASVVLERAIYSFTAVLVLLVGLLYALTRSSVSETSGILAVSCSLLIIGGILITTYGFQREWPVIRWCTSAGKKLPFVGKIVARHEEGALSIERKLYDYRRAHPSNFRRIFA